MRRDTSDRSTAAAKLVVLRNEHAASYARLAGHGVRLEPVDRLLVDEHRAGEVRRLHLPCRVELALELDELDAIHIVQKEDCVW